MPQHIFIVGYPRSGTTLLQSLFISQKSIVSIPETFYFDYFFGQGYELGISKQTLTGYFKLLADRLGHSYVNNFRDAVLNSNYPSDHASLFEFIFENVYKSINNEICDFPIYLEKTPAHIYCLDSIIKHFPEAYFINVVRHPVFSVYSKVKHFSTPSTEEYIKETLEWLRVQDIYNKFMRCYPNQAFLCRYDELISRKEKIFVELFDQMNNHLDLSKTSINSNLTKMIITSNETWKSDNLRVIKNTGKKLGIYQVMSLSVFIIQYYSRHSLKLNNFKIYFKSIQIYLFNIIYPILLRLIKLVRRIILQFSRK